MTDNVNHPSHYTKGGIECIEAIKASMSLDGFQDYCKGNVLKYIWRWRDKAGAEDLKKASVYLNWLIESAEKDQPKDAFEYYCQANGQNPPKLKYFKVDPGSLDGLVRDLYFNSIIEDLRICSARKGCFGCHRTWTENGCDMLESDAADAIEFLFKEMEKNRHTQAP